MRVTVRDLKIRADSAARWSKFGPEDRQSRPALQTETHFIGSDSHQRRRMRHLDWLTTAGGVWPARQGNSGQGGTLTSPLRVVAKAELLRVRYGLWAKAELLRVRLLVRLLVLLPGSAAGCVRVLLWDAGCSSMGFTLRFTSKRR